MFSRKLLLFFGLVLLVAVVAANTEEKDLDLKDFDLEDFNLEDLDLEDLDLKDFELKDSEEGLDLLEGRLLKSRVIIKIIRRLIRIARLIARKCLRIAIRNCKQNWPDIKALAKCAKEYLKDTKGRCIIE